jgi:hypothetical protein
MMAAFGVLVVALGLTPLWPVFQTPEFVVAVVGGSVLGAAKFGGRHHLHRLGDLARVLNAADPVL